ncbi:ATP-binding cassette domain-containing protein [Primorskyibacter flagellatus]|uniref:thiamine ABC transporter ATP-binding protein n=1 Tax=Primorskyibacter flagellatus TaxID=1387277 RepID=UPI003A9010B0
MLVLEDLVIGAGAFRVTADLTLHSGASVAIIGPSGAGKSTLLDAIAGFRSPLSGRILWDGQEITRDAPGKRPVGMLFQDNNLFPHLTVTQNLALALRPDGRLASADHAAIAAALDRVGLAGMENRRPSGLSGGQISRAALARVLLQARPIMALDEPFAALGPALKIEMLDVVAQVAAEIGALVLMVSHDPQDAMRFAGQTVFVNAGVAQGPFDTDALFSDPPKALRAYLGR